MSIGIACSRGAYMVFAVAWWLDVLLLKTAADEPDYGTFEDIGTSYQQQ